MSISIDSYRVAFPIIVDSDDDDDNDSKVEHERTRVVDPRELEGQANAILDDPFVWIEDQSWTVDWEAPLIRWNPLPSRVARSLREPHLSCTQLRNLFTALYHAGNFQRAKAAKLLRRCKRYSVNKSSVRKKCERLREIQEGTTLWEGLGAVKPISLPQKQEAIARITCPVCQQQDVNMVTGCGHVFCRECLMSWKELSRKCPQCRKSLKVDHPLYI